MRRAAARDLALQAADAYDAGDYETALDRFTRAQKLYPAPTLSVMQARCLIGLGRWVEGFEKFNETARTELAADAPSPFVQAVDEAKLAAAELHQRLPRIEIRAPRGTTIAVDGRPLPNALHDVSHPIDPGVHRVVASARGEVYSERMVEVAEKQREVIEIDEPPPRKPRTDVGAADTESVTTPPWLMPTSFAVGGAGTLGAVGSLIVASGAKSKLDEVCTPACPASAEDDLGRYRFYRTAFFVSAAVGAVGLGVGLYLVVVDETDTHQISMQLSPSGASLRARF
jgi:hypothetical protein